MAQDPKKKKKKKTKHTNLVAPGEGSRKPRPQQNQSKSIYHAATGISHPSEVEQKKTQAEPFDVKTAPVEEEALSEILATRIVQKGKSNRPKEAEQQSEEKDFIPEQNKKPKGQTTQFPAIKRKQINNQQAKNPKKNNQKKKPTEKKEPEKLPPNARKMPDAKERQKMAVKAGRHKKRMRWIRFFAGIVVAGMLVLAYFLGIYASLINSISNGFETIRIEASGGEGFPNDFTVSGFRQVQSMGDGGIAALGDKDMAILSSKGRELLRIQHGYASPYIAAGKNRVCVYNRGSSEYILTNRTKVLQKSNADGEMLFAEVSNNGSLLLATASQYRSTVEVYDPTNYDTWRWRWSSAEDIPIGATFANNNKTMALACVTPGDASIASTIYLFKTDRSQESGSEMAKITGASGVPVQMLFVGSKLLVVYDTGYSALYDKKGNEIARYEYDGAVLHTASLTENGLALLFGSSFQDNSHMVYLNTSLEVLGETTISSVLVSNVLVGKNGVYALGGQEVFGFTKDLSQVDTHVEYEKTFGLVWGGKPILLSATGATSLEDLISKKTGVKSVVISSGNSVVENEQEQQSTDNAPEMG